MFNAYITKIMPIPIANIEISQKNPYLYRITVFASLLNENRDKIDKILYKNNRIKKYDGWFFKPNDFFYKQAYIEFKKIPSKT